MFTWVVLTSVLGSAFAGGLSYLNPADVAYSSTAYGNLAFRNYDASPLLANTHLTAAQYATAPLAPVAASYAATPLAAASYAAPFAAASYASPLAATSYAAPFNAASYAAPLATTSYAAPYAATYAAAPYAAVPAVHHVPAVADVPITKVEAQPAVIQNVVDVAHPKVATRRYEIRRPAIQKQFYDIEERVVVRPAGSAVLELEQPLSTNQRGPTQVSSALAAHPAEVSYIPQVAAQVPVPAPVQTFPQPQPFPSEPIQQIPTQQQPQFDDDSVSVDNPEIARFRIQQAQEEQQQQSRLNSLLASRAQISQPLFRGQLEPNGALLRQQIPLRDEAQTRQQVNLQPQISVEQRPTAQPQAQELAASRSYQPAQISSGPSYQSAEQLAAQYQSAEQAASRSYQSAEQLAARYQSAEQSAAQSFQSAGLASSRSYQSDVIPSGRNLSPEQDAANQERYINLITARGGVAELRSSQEGSQVRARVLSATPAPPRAGGEERVNTRRVVVNRPIQTVQEVDVVEPFTKLERVAVHQPALVKTARLAVARVPTSLPVQTYAHAHYI